jgi:hypothetical protein
MITVVVRYEFNKTRRPIRKLRELIFSFYDKIQFVTFSAKLDRKKLKRKFYYSVGLENFAYSSAINSFSPAKDLLSDSTIL